MKHRNKQGQFARNFWPYKWYIVSVLVGTIYTFSMIGLNNAWLWVKSFDRVLLVDKTYAEETITITWQDEVKHLLKDYGVDVEYATKLIFCESSWNSRAIHYNKGSVDRGLWQINSFYHPEVSKDCAYDTACSTIEAIRIIKTKGFGEWSCNSLIK